MVWSAGDESGVRVRNSGRPAKKQQPRMSCATFTGLRVFLPHRIVLHVLAVFKHMIVNRDGTFDKIMIADSGRQDQPAGARQ
jgi:hypothetical protein